MLRKIVFLSVLLSLVPSVALADVDLPIHSLICTTTGPTSAKMTGIWAQYDALGRYICPPKPAVSYYQSTFTNGSWCIHGQLGGDKIVKDIPQGTQGCTLHKEYGAVSHQFMHSDCNGIPTVPSFEFLLSWTD